MKEYSLSILGRLRMQLWNGHAAVMVGSGFSCNADRISTSRPAPPNWLEFSRRLAAELYPGKSQDEIDSIAREQDALELAQIYEASFSRSSLDDFVKRTIDNDNLEPNFIFTQLLDLPWTDIFTTNYDTLLERTAQNLLNRKYDVVYSHQDLAQTKKPRIIKLHGSLSSSPSNLIVTEEDYRTYPRKFAPFVNTVQQALMENSLCLVGFSGSDPNFKEWMGWVRDNLKEAMLPIYLLSVRPLPESERSVLRTYNVHAVDLSCLAGSEEVPPNKQFELLFEYLRDRPDKNEEWIPSILSSGVAGHPNAQTVETVKDLERMRKKYPQWLVMPWEKRESLCIWMDLNFFAIAGLGKLPPPWDLKGLYEINWYRERILLPLLNLEVYQRVLKRYSPFDSKTSQTEYPECKPEEIRRMWQELAFAVCRFHRENGHEQEWTTWHHQLAELGRNDTTVMNRLTWEQVMMAFARCDVKQAVDLMDQWRNLAKTPYWSVKYASVLFELGKEKEAVCELENTLEQIRNALKARRENDYELMGLEGAILATLQLTDINSNPPQGGKNNKFTTIRARLKELEKLGCNPLAEADRFDLLLSGQVIPDVGVSRRRNFDSTTESIKTQSGLPASLKHAYQCARFFEESCLPLHVGICVTSLTKALYGCIRRLAPVAPAWAFSLLCRLGSKDDVDEELFFSQRHLAAASLETINQSAEKTIRQVKYLLENWPRQQSGFARSYHSSALKIFLEVLSRLSCKASDNVLEEIFDVGIRVAKSSIPGLDLVAGGLFEKYFRRVIRTMKGEALFRKMPDLLYLASPVAMQSHRFWQNPFLNLDWHGFTASPVACSTDLTKQINDVIVQVKSENRQSRTEALIVLDRLGELGILTDGQKRQFSENVCCHMNKGQLPDFQWVYPHAYLTFLAPVMARTQIESIVKNAYLAFDFKAHVHADTGWLHLDGRFHLMMQSMLQTSSVVSAKAEKKINLTRADAVRLFHAFCAGLSVAIEEVETAPKPVLFPGHDARSVFKEALDLYDRVLGEVIVPSMDDTAKAEVETFFQSVGKQWRFPVSDLALHGRSPGQIDRIAREIMVGFSSDNEMEFNSCLQTYSNWCRLAAKSELSAPPPEIMHGLLDVIAMRTGEPFRRACSVLGQLSNVAKFTQVDESILLETLERLVALTSFEDSSPRFPAEDHLDYRVAVARLAGRLYKLHAESGPTMPSALTCWKEICENLGELAPVRNAWAEAVS